MTVTEQVLALASLEQDGEPKIPGLRIYVKRVPGQDWLPVDPQDAAWVLLEYRGCTLAYRGAGIWEYTLADNTSRYTPWEAVIAAAYAAEIGGT
jgi:hypothetical protein